MTNKARSEAAKKAWRTRKRRLAGKKRKRRRKRKNTGLKERIAKVFL